MNILKTTLMTTALILGTASASFAQDAMMDKAKDMAVDKAVDTAKDAATDTAVDVVGEDKAMMVEPAMDAVENMIKGDSASEAVMKVGKAEAKDAVMSDVDVSMDTEDAMTASKVIMKGGSAEDAAMAVAKDRAKDQLMEKAENIIMEEVGSSTVVMDEAVVETSTVVATDPTGAVLPVEATVTTTTTPAAAQTVVVNCPAGTTGQPDGSCMITGDYDAN